MAKNTSKPTPTNEGEPKVRTTVFVKEATIYKLDYITKIEFIKNQKDLTRTDLINDALEDLVSKWEKKNGEIPAKQ